MSDYITLLGAEDVRSAASTMSSAAASISSSCSSLAYELERDRNLRDEAQERAHNRREEALDRFEALVGRLEKLWRPSVVFDGGSLKPGELEELLATATAGGPIVERPATCQKEGPLYCALQPGHEGDCSPF
jgi:hypothetical protein